MKTLLFSLTVVLAFVSAAGAEARQLVLRDRVEVSGDWIQLQDLTESRVAKELGVVNVLRAPGVARERIVSGLYINLHLKRAGLSSQYSVPPEAELHIYRKGMLLPAAEIERNILNYVEKSYDYSNYSNHVIEFSRETRDFTIKKGDYNFVVKGPRYYKGKGHGIFYLIIKKGQTAVKKIPVGVVVRVYNRVYIASKRLSFGGALSPSDFTVREMDVTYTKSPYTDEIQSGSKLVLRRFKRKGTVLFTEDVGINEVVHRGDRLELICSGKNLKVTVPAEALQDGKTGDSIWVKNLSSGSKILARVVRPGTAEINFR